MAIEANKAYDAIIEELIKLASEPDKDAQDLPAILNKPVAAIIDAAFQQKKLVDAAAAAHKKVKKVFDLLEWAALRKMETLGDTTVNTEGVEVNIPLLKAGGLFATATVTESEQPNVTDWDDFYKYIIENDMMHLLQKRAAANACRELWEMGDEIAGVEPYTKRALSLRKA